MVKAGAKWTFCAFLLLWSVPSLGQETGVADLYLEVTINGAPTRLIAQFRQAPDGSLSTPATELEELGLRSAGERQNEWITLSSIEGLTYTYQPERQALEIKIASGLRLTRTYDAASNSDDLPEPDRSFGAVLNYTAFLNAPLASDWLKLLPQGGNMALDGHIFTSFGNLEQSGILGSTLGREGSFLRLDTAFVYSDPAGLRTYRGGDIISGSLPWTRAIRMGGAQVQSDFGLRPDLVTAALPRVSGSALVPSTVDVMVGGTRIYSGEVNEGPFEIANLPAGTGSKDASVIVRDVTGKLVETTTPLYDTSRLLRPGLLSFSAEAGRPRLFYGLESNSYGADLVGSASARYGLARFLTLEAHAEGGASLVHAGAGATAVLGSWGTLSLAASGSRFDPEIGGQMYGSFETRWRGLTLHLSSRRTFGEFNDLASVTAPYSGTAAAPREGALLWSAVPKALDQLSLSTPGLIQGSSLNLNLINAQTASGEALQIATASYSQKVGSGHLFATSLVGLNDKRIGFYAGVSFPLGGGGYASSGVTLEQDRLALALDASKPLGTEPGSVGWRVRGAGAKQLSAFDLADYSGAVGYRTRMMRVEAGAEKAGSGLRGTLLAEGAIAITKDGVFASNRIDDAFAVVDVGAAGVPVLLENNVVAHTDFRGKALVPQLPSFQTRKIAIDSAALPLSANVTGTSQRIRPARRSGVSVDLKVRSDAPSAFLELVYPDGRHVEPGSQGHVEGGEAFTVGYEGQALVRAARGVTRVTIKAGDRNCTAEFDVKMAAAGEAGHAQIGQTACR